MTRHAKKRTQSSFFILIQSLKQPLSYFSFVNSIAVGRSVRGSQYGLCSTPYSSQAHMSVVCTRFIADIPRMALGNIRA